MWNKKDVPEENRFAVLGIGLGGFYHKNYDEFMNFPDGHENTGMLLSDKDVYELISNTKETEDKWLYIHDVKWINDELIQLVNGRKSEDFKD